MGRRVHPRHRGDPRGIRCCTASRRLGAARGPYPFAKRELFRAPVPDGEGMGQEDSVGVLGVRLFHADSFLLIQERGIARRKCGIIRIEDFVRVGLCPARRPRKRVDL